VNKIIFTVNFGLYNTLRLGWGVMTSFSRRTSLAVFAVSFLILFKSKHTYISQFLEVCFVSRH